MELEDIEVGMVVKDNFDNWYKIINISRKENDHQPVKLLCIFLILIMKIIFHEWMAILLNLNLILNGGLQEAK